MKCVLSKTSHIQLDPTLCEEQEASSVFDYSFKISSDSRPQLLSSACAGDFSIESMQKALHVCSNHCSNVELEIKDCIRKELMGS